MQYRFCTADVFTDRPFGGNPLAVFLDARGLDTVWMRLVAREFNLSETVFVFPAERPGHMRRLRIFTPEAELPFAGHPTIGAAHVLASLGLIPLAEGVTRIVFEEGVGPVPVSIHAQNGQPVFVELTAGQLPEFGPPPPAVDSIAATLSLAASDVLGGENAPQAVSCGIPFLFVPVRGREVLARVRVDRALWQQHLATYWAPHLYVFSFDGEMPRSDVRARMFAPGLGIAEDPATGAAAAALAGYLGRHRAVQGGTLRWQIEQGFEMGRPSLVRVEADTRDGTIVSVRVGGASVLVSEGTMKIPVLA
jgi:trans-2,3-dihydro-3-hydroxyanthranilate isomerase